MKFTETLERWLGHSRRDADSDSETDSLHLISPSRFRKICNQLGDDVDPEALDMLASRGFEDEAIFELIQATNMLHCRMMGNLDLEINKMYAEEILLKYGYRNLDQFEEELRHYHEHTSPKH